MLIGGFQKLTLLDFPGEVACIVFTSGCNFRCPFCHNSGLVISDTPDIIEKSEIFDYLKKRRGVIDGVVITGGEPLIQSGIKEFIKELRCLGLKIKLDTNGSLPERLESLINDGLIDYIAMDIKHTPEEYSRAIGVNSDDLIFKIDKSVELIKNSGIKSEFRTTFVKGIHSPGDAEKIARRLNTDIPYYLQSYKNSENIIAPEGLSPFSSEELSQMLSGAKRFCQNSYLRSV